MERRDLGAFGPVSALTLGGGGLGQLWGPTDHDEAVATVHAAVAAGIDLLDVAPSYGRGEAERVIGDAFGGRLPDGVRVTTKVMLGEPDEPVLDAVRRSLARSLDALRLDRVDLLFLHNNYIVDDGRMIPGLGDLQPRLATSWSTYCDGWRPAMAALVDEGVIGGWGITGTGPPATIIAALRDEPRPVVVQAITNFLDSAAEIVVYEEPQRPRDVIATAVECGVGVLGIRAVGAGALTDGLDRDLPAGSPIVADFDRAAPVRDIARSLGMSTAALAHRYALGMDGVASVVLGVKNRAELAECVAAAEAGPLPPAAVTRIDAAL